MTEETKTLSINIPWKEYTTTSGYNIRIRPCPQLPLRKLLNDLHPPQPPTTRDKATNTVKPDPNDPKYLQEMEEFNAIREQLSQDFVIALSVDLGGELPPIEEWKEYIEEIDEFFDGGFLNTYDLEKEIDRKILFLKAFVLPDTTDVSFVITNATVSAAGVRAALDQFRNKT